MVKLALATSETRLPSRFSACRAPKPRAWVSMPRYSTRIWRLSAAERFDCHDGERLRRAVARRKRQMAAHNSVRT